MALSRRGFLTATAVGVLAAPTAKAWQVVEGPWPGLVPPRDGVVAWQKLLAAKFGNFTAPPSIPPDVLALHGTSVKIEGYPLMAEAATKELVLTALQTHCPFCLPTGMAGLVTVNMAAPLTVADATKTLTLTGTFAVEAEQTDGFIYWLDNARLV